MSNTTFTVLHSVGIRTNRQIERTESSSKPAKLRKPTASHLKALGYTTSERQIILANL